MAKQMDGIADRLAEARHRDWIDFLKGKWKEPLDV